ACLSEVREVRRSGRYQRAAVPPQAWIERDVVTKQRWLEQKRLDHEQPRERFANDPALFRNTIPLGDLRNEFVANEAAERRGTADTFRNCTVARNTRWASEVATALGIWYSNNDQRAHCAQGNQRIDCTCDMHEVFVDATIWHVQHG